MMSTGTRAIETDTRDDGGPRCPLSPRSMPACRRWHRAGSDVRR
jgi:hypothetical protein